MVEVFVLVFGLGLALFAAPGPIIVATVRYGVQHGFRPALGVQLGALAAELVWAAAVFGGLGSLARQPAAQLLLTLLSAAFLLWSGWQALRASEGPSQTGHATRDVRSATLVGALYAGSNPLTVVFWMTVMALLTERGVLALGPQQWLVVASAYVLGALTPGVPLALLATLGSRHARPVLLRGSRIASGLVLGACGLHLLWTNLL